MNPRMRMSHELRNMNHSTFCTWSLNKKQMLTFPKKSIRVKNDFLKGYYGGSYQVELFNDLIYDYVIPRLKDLGVNMDYNEETAETNYERVMRENYE